MGSHNDDHNQPPASGDEQERQAQRPPDATTESVEQYTQLHEYIEQLQADARPRPPENLSSEEVRAYQMAAFFRAAAPGAAEPTADFVATLHARIEHELALDPTGAVADARTDSRADAQRGKEQSAPKRRVKTSVSRRGLLTAGLSAAAAVVGVAAGAIIEHSAQGSSTPPPMALIPEGAGTWVAIARDDELSVGGVKRFTAGYIVGFLRRTATGYVALSGVCTHMSCLLLWNSSDRTYDCPCHGGRFNESGASASNSRFTYAPLPKIATKVEQGEVLAYVAKSGVSSSDATPDSTSPAGASDPSQKQFYR